MKIISFANQKGGCGKTLTAVNMAGGLAAVGKKVLFIDLDPQAHASASMGFETVPMHESSYAIFDAFLKNEILDVKSLMRKKYKNLWVIPSHISLSTMEQKMSSAKDATLVLNILLKKQDFDMFDHIVIDTPPNLGFLTFNALHASTRVIVPLDTSIFSLRGVSYIKDILELSKNMGFQKPKVSYLINMYDGRSNFAKNFLVKAKERFGEDLLKTTIRPNIKLREAALEGKVIFEHAPSSNGAIDYTSLLKELSPDIQTEYITLRWETAAVKSEPVQTEDKSDKKILFKINAPEAQAVYVAGSFNNWHIDKESLMKKLENGIWVKMLSLIEGDHRYKFVVDGQWVQDPNNEITEENDFGGKDSLISIKNKAV